LSEQHREKHDAMTIFSKLFSEEMEKLQDEAAVKVLKFLGVAAVVVPLGIAVAFVLDDGKAKPAIARAGELAAQASTQASTPAPLGSYYGNGACSVVQIYIEDRVKSPGSESFSGCHMVSVSDDRKVIVVAGSVTAANSFNARIRSNYRATLARKPEAPINEDDYSTWRLTSIDMS
jgi:hypothetical protein